MDMVRVCGTRSLPGCTVVNGMSGLIQKPHQIENIVLTTIRDTKLIKLDSATICDANSFYANPFRIF